MKSLSKGLRKDVYGKLEEIKKLVGETEYMDAIVAFMLVKYSDEYSFRAKKGSAQEGAGSCGVGKSR